MIGIFDSGVGGLTAVRAFDRISPASDLVYFGDTARVPYGTRSPEVINRYALQDCRFLVTLGVEAILVACGTVSSNSLSLLRASLDVPVTGVVESASAKACEEASAGNGLVVVLGTPATVKSGAYEKEIHKIDKSLRVLSRACPLFVPLVENGRTSVGDIIAETAVREYCADFAALKPSAVILGCTHYPLLSELINAILPESVLVNTAEESVKEMVKSHSEKAAGNGARSFYVSDDPEGFAKNGKVFLHKDISDKVTLIDIEDY